MIAYDAGAWAVEDVQGWVGSKQLRIRRQDGPQGRSPWFVTRQERRSSMRLFFNLGIRCGVTKGSCEGEFKEGESMVLKKNFLKEV